MSADLYQADVSVRALAAFHSPEGDITTSGKARRNEREGMLVHQEIQKSRPDMYNSEVSVSYIYETDDIRLLIRGRIDGILDQDGQIIIEEIKSTGSDIDEVVPGNQHLAQAKIYAAILAAQKGYASICVRLTYVHFGTRKQRAFDSVFTSDELRAFFTKVIEDYIAAVRRRIARLINRNRTLEAVPFPFSRLREGQEAFMTAVSDTVRDGGKLFARAPTGIGKTAAAIFPSLRRMAFGECDVIFYLSARTSTQQNAEQFVGSLRGLGAEVRGVTISARSKVCFLGLSICKPEGCPYAEGYYERLPDLISTLYEEQIMDCTRERICDLAATHVLCPHELSLDIALESDIIICDYNYIFDPMVYLRRFLIEGDTSRYVLLVDEAHNLVDRGRDMYTGEVRKRQMLACRRLVDKQDHPALHRALSNLNEYCIAVRKEMKIDGVQYTAAEEIDEFFVDNVRELVETFQEHFGLQRDDYVVPDELLELYRTLLQFSAIYDLKDEGHAATVELVGSDVIVKLLCIDPSFYLSRITNRCRATMFFSATLTPFDYFMALLDGGEDVRELSLGSPFPKEHLRVYVDTTVSTRYRDRGLSVERILDYVRALCGRGNFLFFFPSYAYLEMTLKALEQSDLGIDVQVQRSGMGDEERQGFLEMFEEDDVHGRIGFAVLGGVFGEGIDLTGTRLIGAIIVGVGLPSITNERNLMQEYYERRFQHGFSYAYQYPGMNRVLQAAGRVIRDENDRGIVVFIGQRHGSSSYRRLLTPEYMDYQIVESAEEVLAGVPAAETTSEQ